MTAAGDHAAYDALARHYRDIKARRADYLAAVDAAVVAGAPAGRGALLDVGAGDGERGMALACRLGIARVVLCEPSQGMAELCRRFPEAILWRADAAAMPLDQGSFDVIVCLWNVLGHIPDREGRLAALSRMAALLAPGGRLFLDVNNRYNAPAYGRVRVAWRMLLDWLRPDDRRGDVRFAWEVGGRRIPASGHLFTPAEMRGLFARAGLAVLACQNIDYVTGQRSRLPWRGQRLYVAGRAADQGGRP